MISAWEIPQIGGNEADAASEGEQERGGADPKNRARVARIVRFWTGNPTVGRSLTQDTGLLI